MATQQAKLGYLKDSETGKIFLPKTTWDSIIEKPDNLNHAYNSKITIRGSTFYPNYTNFGSFTLNQSTNANINLPAFLNGNVGLVPQYSLASFSKGQAFLDEKGNWNTALTTGFNDYYIAGAGVDITSAPVIKTYKIDNWIEVSSIDSSGPQFCGSINDVAPTSPGIYKFISPYGIIAMGFVNFMFIHGPLIKCYYGTSNDNTSKEWIPYNLSDAVEYYFEYKDSNFYFLGTDIHTISTTQIQSNWNESDTNSAAYILNKPTKLSDFTNDLNLFNSDTLDTAGATESSETLYLIGSPTKTGAPTTYTSKTDVFMTDGLLHIKNLDVAAGLYYNNSVWGINLNNSDIIRLHGLYFQDLARGVGQGLNFYRTNTTWDSLRMNTGKLQVAFNKTTTNVGTWRNAAITSSAVNAGTVSPASTGTYYPVQYNNNSGFGVVRVPTSSGNTTINPMAAYAVDGSTYGTLYPDVFAIAFMYNIINGAVTNDCSIITDKFRIQDYNSSGIDGHVSAAALILLYAAYLSRNGFTSGRLEWETHGYGDYFSYLLCTGTSQCYSVGTDDSAIFQSNGITVYTFNWTQYSSNNLPIGINDYNCDATGIGGNSSSHIAHKYIFTFSNVQLSNMESLYNVLSIIKDDSIDTYKKAADDLNAIIKDSTQLFKSMTVRIEHKSVNQSGFNVFHP